MARQNEFKKTKYTGIYSLKTANGKEEFYATFRLQGEFYQNKNLTKDFFCTTAKKASERLDEIKVLLRQGINPFSGNIDSEKVEDIVITDIQNKKPKKAGKDNSKYKRNLENFYYAHIHPVIGHLKPEKVNSSHINKILDGLSDTKKGHKLNVHVLMYKIFDDLLRKRQIDINPFHGIDYGNHEGKPSLDIRLNEPSEMIAIKLFKASLEYKGPHKLLFLLSIMLARRIGEVHQLKFSHIKRFSTGEYYVLTTPDITKTGIEEKYPLPSEAIELLPDNILNPDYANEKLFPFAYSGIFLKYNVLVKNAKLQINDKHKITSHDNRHLFITILSQLGVLPDLADHCLSHYQQKTSKDIYLNSIYEARKSIFHKWWKFLREGAEKLSSEI